MYQAAGRVASRVRPLTAGGVIETSPVDGVHLDEAAHAALGEAVVPVVLGLLATRE